MILCRYSYTPSVNLNNTDYCSAIEQLNSWITMVSSSQDMRTTK